VFIVEIGQAGAIGTNTVLVWFVYNGEPIVNIGKVRYVVNQQNLAFLQGDIRHIVLKQSTFSSPGSFG